jgi:hypothetical protein
MLDKKCYSCEKIFTDSSDRWPVMVSFDSLSDKLPEFHDVCMDCKKRDELPPVKPVPVNKDVCTLCGTEQAIIQKMLATTGGSLLLCLECESFVIKNYLQRTKGFLSFHRPDVHAKVVVDAEYRD